MTLSLVTWPDERLTVCCRPVEVFDDALASTASEMVRLMLEEGGVGLAAPQVGSDLRMFVTAHVIDGPTVFVNPVVTCRAGLVRGQEGCLSLPDARVEVWRAASVSVEARHVTGERFRFDIDGSASSAAALMARCVQHENDHLDGKTMLDRIDPATRLGVLMGMARGHSR